MVQTAIARAMASTFTRRVDGMFKGRRSKEPQLWPFSKNVQSGLGLEIGCCLERFYAGTYGIRFW